LAAHEKTTKEKRNQCTCVVVVKLKINLSDERAQDGNSSKARRRKLFLNPFFFSIFEDITQCLGLRTNFVKFERKLFIDDGSC
jgi:hypothetical protein